MRGRGTGRGYGRAFVIIVVGLAAAFGVFRWLSWPSTLDGVEGNRAGFGEVAVGELMHAGLGPFEVTGSREIEILRVELIDPTPGLELVSTRMNVFGKPGAVILGFTRGPDPEIDALPQAVGYPLRSGDEGGIYVTVRAATPGAYSFQGIRVIYQTGWLRRSKVLGPVIEATVSATATPQPPIQPRPTPSPT